MATTPFRVPADNGGHDAWIVGAGATAAAKRVTRSKGTDFLMNVPLMAGFAIEEYDYYNSGRDTATTGKKYQLVGYGPGPGFGPDYTRYKTTQTQTNYVGETTNTALGPTAGKYLMFAGLDLALLQPLITFFFNELAGIRNDSNGTPEGR